MIWTEQFHDRATFYQISYETEKTQQKKVETVLYDCIPCNLVEREQPFSISADQGEQENIKYKRRCDVSGSYGGAERNDRVVINGRNFIILNKIADTDFSGNILFYKYDLQEKT